ncbi:hypothetical protein EYZ11_012599 [Aspergillus tanneri]|uniref:Complex III subunit 7 n=1 Tax=Aspergillus tanneri TaxID=1220188 RepID=A0A4S3IZU5_9EURO|nr:hypothetical protein EYZ11_012599 [Aspergillus tanneri]
MSAPSLTSYIVKRPWLKRWMTPIANWFDDLIPEESVAVQTAIKRLPPKEAYDRVFRIRRAFQCSVSHTLLPAAEQTKPEDDVEYLSPIIREVEKEQKERADLDNLIIKR